MSEQDIFIKAIGLSDPAERAKFLDNACEGNALLRARVEQLLQQSQQVGSFLEHPPVSSLAQRSTSGDPSFNMFENLSENAEPAQKNGPPAGTPADTVKMSLPDGNEISLSFLEPSDQPDSIGRLGHYEVLEVIGSGAFGIVLRTFDTKLQRVVAIKVLSPQMAVTSPARKRFLREARSSAAVRHENVVAIYAVEDEPVPYLVMEYIPGETLQQRLDEHGPLDLPSVLRLGQQVADGLAAAHAQGLIHRDIKPGNILLEGGMDDRVKLTDFGLARTADDASMTQSGVIAGTPMYMAPEQALGTNLDQRADLFSLGSVMYQMLSGRPPFRAPNTLAVLKRVTEDTPRPIQEVVPEVPDWICKLIGHLHAKKPEHRYDSARTVSQILQQCVHDLQSGREPKIPDPTKETDTDEEAVSAPSGTAAQPSHTAGMSDQVTRNTGSGARMAAGIFGVLITLLIMVGLGSLYFAPNNGSVLVEWNPAITAELQQAGFKVVNTETGTAYTVKIADNSSAATRNNIPVGQYRVESIPRLNIRDDVGAAARIFDLTRKERQILRLSIASDLSTDPNPSAVRNLAIPAANLKFALQFDGVDDYVETPIRYDGSTPITVEATVQINDWSDNSNGEIMDNSGEGGFTLSASQFGFYFAAKLGERYEKIWTSLAREYVGRPLALAGVRDGSTLRLYVDGKLVNQKTFSGGYIASTTPISVGTNLGDRELFGFAPRNWRGKIFSMRISDTVRAPEELITTQSASNPIDEHTLALYQFGGGQGETLKDSSGNEQHGKIVGARWLTPDASRK